MTAKPAARAAHARFLPALLFSLLCCGAAPAWVGASPPRANPQRDSKSQARAVDEAARLQKQARELYAQGRYDEAARLLERALSKLEAALDPGARDIGTITNDLALMYSSAGALDDAERLYLRAVSILEKSPQATGTDLAGALLNLGQVYITRGNLTAAEATLRRVMEVVDARDVNVDVLIVLLNNYGHFYSNRGNYVAAERLHNLAIQYCEKAPQTGCDLFPPLFNLGHIYQHFRQDPAAAERLYLRALDVAKKKDGAESPKAINVLLALQTIYSDREEFDRAEGTIRQAMKIIEKRMGKQSMLYGVALNNLAVIHLRRREYAAAEPMFHQAAEAFERAVGPDNPEFLKLLNNFAWLYMAMGDLPRAVRAQERVNEAQERQLNAVIATGAEVEKLLSLYSFAAETSLTVSLSARGGDAAAARLGLTTVLRRKGRVLDTAAGQVQLLRQRLSLQDKNLLDDLARVRSQVAALGLRGPAQDDPAQYKQQLRSLDEEALRLEGEISSRSAAFREQARPVAWEAVQRALPEGALLVEFLTYSQFNPHWRKRGEVTGPERYAAYVLRREGDPSFVDLGEVGAVEGAVTRLRAALSDPARGDVKRAARELDELVTRPVRGLAEGARHAFVSPDGALNLVPFAALVDEQGRYLVETHSFTYLTSGRDLLRLEEESAPSRQEAVVIADPAFDVAVATSPAGAGGARAIDFASLNLRPLPGTAQEAAAIKGIIPGARVLTGAAATESALKQVSGPRFLHIATHGFFLQSRPAPPAPAARPLNPGEPEPPPERVPHPLTNSGLVLAGAAKAMSGDGEDGVLTALEAAGLDLWGTKLVVLSACETGVGEVVNSEGVYGLRRALTLAGAESQLMSLWQVSDSATRDLMTDYYRRLARGEGRTESLRAAQLGMLRRGKAGGASPGRQLVMEEKGPAGGADYAHPYYWASFIPVGDWRGINRVTAPSPESPPRGPVATAMPPPAQAARPSAQVAKPSAKAGPVSRRPAPAAKGRPDGGQTFEAQMRAASDLARQGKYDEAEPGLERALALRPDDFGALTAMGEVKYARGDFAGAASFFERALAIRPGTPQTSVRLGDTYFNRTPPAYDRALAEYRAALAGDAKNERAWQGIAAAALRLRNTLVARDAIKTLASLYPSNPALPELQAGLENLLASPAGPAKQPAQPRPGNAPARAHRETPTGVLSTPRAAATPAPTKPGPTPVLVPEVEGRRTADLAWPLPREVRATDTSTPRLYTSFMEPSYAHGPGQAAGVKLSSVAAASVEGNVGEIAGKTKVYVSAYTAVGLGSEVGYEDLETVRIIIKTLERDKSLEVVFTPEASDFIIHYVGVVESEMKTSGDMVAIARGAALPDGTYTARVVWKDHNSRIRMNPPDRPNLFDIMSRHPADNMTRHLVDALKKARGKR